MVTPLHVLILEDRPTDAELMLRTLRQSEFDPTWQRVETEAEYLVHLHANLDVILADYSLPQFDALRALRRLQEHGLDVPFIVVTGSASEEVAVECLKQGAADYVLKERLRRLGPAVERALAEKRLRTEKQHTEGALRDSEARYRELFENANDLVYVHDLAGNFLAINKAAERISGYARDEALGMNLNRVVAPEYQELARQMITRKVAGEEATTYELALVTKSGRRVLLEVSSRLVCRDGKPVAVQGIARDITERKQLEAQLHRVQRMEALGTLAGGIAHDFNNILTAMLGFTELTLDEVAQESRAWRNLQEVLTAGQRAKDLVRQILTFSRQTEQARKPVQLHPIIQEALKLLRASLPSTIEIQEHVSAEVGTVLANPTQMHQVFMNLCTNAAYAMRETGGVLEVRLDAAAVDATFAAAYPPLRPGPYMRLTVQDTGRGMAPGVLERIFEPFFTTKGVGEGTGMGLAVVHGIVTGHEGVITVASTPGGSTTFVVYLPRIEEAAVAGDHPEGAIPHGNEHILFVDDEAVLVRLGQEMFTSLGYTVTVRTSNIEALEAFRAMPQRFTLVITDQTMPNMTGEALAHELRRIRPNIPIILCTGFSHTMTEENAKAFGIDALLMKPFGARDMGLVIRRVLEQSHTR